MIESKPIYNGKIISVRVDKLQVGGRTTVREIVEHGGSAAILPLLGDTIIMEKQYRHSVGKELLEIPAGTLEKGESPEDCAARELIEETGYRAGTLELLGKYYVSPGYSTEMIYFFVAKDLTRAEHSEPDMDEQISLVRISLDDAVRMVLSNEIEDGKTVYAILTYLQKARG